MARRADDWRDRFWAKVDRSGGPAACWPWRGGVSDNGYGQFDRGGRKVGAHRIAYEAVNGPLPRGRIARHTCDTPLCCNPAHIVAGTHLDNMADRTERGRNTVLRGAANGRTSIDEETVRSIYIAVKHKHHPQAHVARMYNVKPSLVYDIVHRRAHTHVTEGL